MASTPTPFVTIPDNAGVGSDWITYGAVWAPKATTPFTLSQVIDNGFETTFSYQTEGPYYVPSQNNGRGFVFALQNQAVDALDVVDNDGFNFGFSDITNGIGIGLRWEGNGVSPRLGVWKTNATPDKKVPLVYYDLSTVPWNDTNIHSVTVQYIPSTLAASNAATLLVYFDFKLRLTFPIDLAAAVFGGSSTAPVWAGFTGAVAETARQNQTLVVGPTVDKYLTNVDRLWDFWVFPRSDILTLVCPQLVTVYYQNFQFPLAAENANRPYSHYLPLTVRQGVSGRVLTPGDVIAVQGITII